MYSWGSGSHGQLGLGNLDDYEVPQPCISDLEVKRIVGGGSHTLLFTEQGVLYGCGNDEDGQLGLGVSKQTTFLRIEGLGDEEIIEIGAGWNHSVALTNKGNVYTWGSNKFHQLGRKEDVAMDPIPTLIHFGWDSISIRTISCGLRHTLVITQEGLCFAWGENRYGQCGTSSSKTIMKPIQIDSLPKSVGVSCGARHTIVTTDTGDCYAFGSNKFGQCGVDSSKIKMAPTKIESLKNIAKTASGWNHTIALDRGKSLYVFGRNDFGQLGLGHNVKTQLPVPHPSFNGNVADISTGSEHTLVLLDDGKLLAWGWGEHGQVGIGNEEDQHAPVIVSNLKMPVKAIGCGHGCAFALC